MTRKNNSERLAEKDYDDIIGYANSKLPKNKLIKPSGNNVIAERFKEKVIEKLKEFRMIVTNGRDIRSCSDEERGFFSHHKDKIKGKMLKEMQNKNNRLYIFSDENQQISEDAVSSKKQILIINNVFLNIINKANKEFSESRDSEEGVYMKIQGKQQRQPPPRSARRAVRDGFERSDSGEKRQDGFENPTYDKGARPY